MKRTLTNLVFAIVLVVALLIFAFASRGQFGSGTGSFGSVGALSGSAANGSRFTNINVGAFITLGVSNAQYGPFTPGTTTAGFQEALNSVPWPTNASGTNFGIKIMVGPGDFYLTNTAFLSNDWWQSVIISGSGQSATVLHGLSTNVFRTTGKHTATPLPNRGQYWLENMTMMLDNNSTNYVTYFDTYACLQIQNCYFTYKGYATNQSWGGALASLTVLTPLKEVPGVVGIYASADEVFTRVYNCYFQGLAVGFESHCSHPDIRDSFMVHIGIYQLAAANVWTNLWTSNSVNFFGAGAVIDSPKYECYFIHNTCDFSGYGVVLLNEQANIGRYIFQDNYVESMVRGRYASDDIGIFQSFNNFDVILPDKAIYADPSNLLPPYGISGLATNVMVTRYNFGAWDGAGWANGQPKWYQGTTSFTDPINGAHAQIQIMNDDSMRIATDLRALSNIQSATITTTKIGFVSNSVPTITVDAVGSGSGTAALIPGYPANDHDFYVRVVCGAVPVASAPLFQVTYGLAQLQTNCPISSIVSRTNTAVALGAISAHVDDQSLTLTGFRFVNGGTLTGSALSTNDYHFYTLGR